MFPSQVEFLDHILDECNFLLKLHNESTFENITNNRTVAYAICRSFEIIGEATKHVPDELRKNIL